MKPTPKHRVTLNYSDCTDFIEKKHKIQTRDYANSFGQFSEWCAANGEEQTECPPGCSDAQLKAHQAQYARYNADIASGKIAERPYQDFWHWLVDVKAISNGSIITLGKEDHELVEEPWQQEILDLYIREFGDGVEYDVSW